MRGPILCRDCGAHLSTGNAFLVGGASDQRCWSCREKRRSVPRPPAETPEPGPDERKGVAEAQRAALFTNALAAPVCQCENPTGITDEDGDVHCLMCSHSMAA